MKLSGFIAAHEKLLPSVITLKSAISFEAVFASIPAQSGGPNGAEKIALLCRSKPSKQQIQFVLRRHVSPQLSLFFLFNSFLLPPYGCMLSALDFYKSLNIYRGCAGCSEF